MDPFVRRRLGMTLYEVTDDGREIPYHRYFAFYRGDKALQSSTRCPGQRSYQCDLNSGYAQTRNYVSNIKTIAGKL